MSDHIHINVLAANGTDWRRRVSAVLWQLRQDKDGAAITISLKDGQA
jgi:hypothetical protein